MVGRRCVPEGGVRGAGIVVIMALIVATAGSPRAQDVTSSGLDYAFGFDPQLVETHRGPLYDRIEYPGGSQDFDSELYGYPQLPVMTYRFLLPPGTRVSEVEFGRLETEVLEGTYLPRPIQPEFPPGEEQGEYGPLPEIYESHDPYPEHPVEVTIDGEFRAYHLATVKVYPVQFIGATGQLRVIQRLDTHANLRAMTPEELARVHQCRRIDTRPLEERDDLRWLRRAVLNPEDLGPFSPQPGHPSGPRTLEVHENNPFGGFVPTERPSLDGPPIRYVVITDSLDVSGRALGDQIFRSMRAGSTREAG